MLNIGHEQTALSDSPPLVPLPAPQRRAEMGAQSQISNLKSQIGFRPAPRVLMVGTHPTKTLGGISTVVNELLRSPVAAEFDFRYVASQADEYGRFGKFLLSAAALARFALLLAWWRPRLVYVHVGSNASLYRKSAFLALARWAGRRVVAHFHAGDFEHYYARQSRAGRWLIRSGLSCSDHLIAVSRAAGQLLGELLPGASVAVIPNGLDLAAFAAGERGDSPTARLLFVGAMGRLKGEGDLIKALKLAAGRTPQLRVAMLGHGAEGARALCRAAGVERLVEHLGPVPMGERAGYYRRADIFVLPSYGEGLPMSVLEAMAAGLPVVATRVGGIPELIEDGAEGFLVAPGDVGALAERIVRLAEDGALRRRMGGRGRVKVREFDGERVTARLVGELRRALG
jgi:glycosyltransferase involved in cell wall biosynthesis